MPLALRPAICATQPAIACWSKPRPFAVNKADPILITHRRAFCSRSRFRLDTAFPSSLLALIDHFRTVFALIPVIVIIKPILTRLVRLALP